MSNGGKVALAVGAGYMLGRTKKMRLALMLAAAGITGKFPTSPTALVGQGLKSLGANADITQLTEQLRGELLNAGRAAALSAATSQIESLNDRLQGVNSTIDVDETLDDVGGIVGGKRRRKRPEDDYDEDDAFDESDEEDEEDEEPLDVDEVDEDFDDEPDEEPDEEDVDEEDVDEDQALDEDDELEDEPEDEPEPPVTRRRAARRPSAPRKSTRASKRTAARSTTRRGR